MKELLLIKENAHRLLAPVLEEYELEEHKLRNHNFRNVKCFKEVERYFFVCGYIRGLNNALKLTRQINHNEYGLTNPLFQGQSRWRSEWENLDWEWFRRELMCYQEDVGVRKFPEVKVKEIDDYTIYGFFSRIRSHGYANAHGHAATLFGELLAKKKREAV